VSGGSHQTQLNWGDLVSQCSHTSFLAMQDPKTHEERVYFTYMVVPHMVYQLFPNGTAVHRWEGWSGRQGAGHWVRARMCTEHFLFAN
jgi:hypothetical protein